MHKTHLERALYYLNNRHRLTMADVPHYIQALHLAQQYHFVCDRGLWYLPKPPEKSDADKKESA